MMNNASQHQAWFLYDKDCGICRSFANKFESFLNSHGFKLAPLQSDWVKERLKLPGQDLLKDVLLLTKDNKIFKGADVYRYLLKSVWYLKPCYYLSKLPILKQIFDWSYKKIRDNRHKCSL